MNVLQAVWGKTLYTFNMLIHPKDRQDFESFMESEDVAAYAVVRCMTANDSYRWFMLEKIMNR